MCKMPEVCTLEHQEVSNCTQAVDAKCADGTGAATAVTHAFQTCLHTHTTAQKAQLVTC